MKDRRGWRSTNSNEDIEKGQDGRDKSEMGRQRGTSGGKWILNPRAWAASHRGRELYCL